MNKKAIFSVVISALLFSGSAIADSLPSSLSINPGIQSPNNTKINSTTHNNGVTPNNQSMSIPSALEPSDNKKLLATKINAAKPVSNTNIQGDITNSTAIHATSINNIPKTETNNDHKKFGNQVNNNIAQDNSSGIAPIPQAKTINVSHQPANIGQHNQSNNINSIQQTSIDKNNKPTLVINNDNPFTGNSAENAKLTNDYNLWQAKTKIVSTMVKFQKQMNTLKQLKAEGGNIPSSDSSGNVTSNPAIKKLEDAIRSMQLTIDKQNEALREKEIADNNAKKIMRNKPKLISTITYNNKLLAVIRANGKISSYGLNDLVGSNIIQEITPDSVTFTNGKVIDIPQYNTGYIQKAAWEGYPKKNGSLEQRNTISVTNKIPAFPHNNVEPYNIPNSTLPSMR